MGPQAASVRGWGGSCAICTRRASRRSAPRDYTPLRAILTHLQDRGSNFLIMGAYGHSRIRSLVVGSTTTAILQMAQMPVLLVR
ncbi:universal stress protein [Paracoccus sp. MC1854]|uniref:universal stress protein n=1 Tax=Paracoccus sp. MC1854 TaxID=2760306 RepID=UPI002104640B|nr:universal stress protein [Paracoccus sp. MC1854]